MDLADRSRQRLGVFGENPGQGSAEALSLSAAQMKEFGLLGMAWYREEELFSGMYASLDDYRRIIEEYRGAPHTPEQVGALGI